MRLGTVAAFFWFVCLLFFVLFFKELISLAQAFPSLSSQHLAGLSALPPSQRYLTARFCVQGLGISYLLSQGRSVAVQAELSFPSSS